MQVRNFVALFSALLHHLTDTLSCSDMKWLLVDIPLDQVPSYLPKQYQEKVGVVSLVSLGNLLEAFREECVGREELGGGAKKKVGMLRCVHWAHPFPLCTLDTPLSLCTLDTPLSPVYTGHTPFPCVHWTRPFPCVHWTRPFPLCTLDTPLSLHTGYCAVEGNKVLHIGYVSDTKYSCGPL